MTGARPILVVDDDRILRQTLVEQLQLEGEFTVQEAASLAEAREKLKTPDSRFDALLLDVSLPDGDGRDFCAELRKDGLRMPIIMLTGSDDEADIVRGLDAGANDYVAKPFRIAELLARLRARCACLKTVKTPCSASGHIRSARLPSCFRNRRKTVAFV